MAGTRYASVLPVPVRASARTTPPDSNASATAFAISIWPARGSKPGIVRPSGPPGENMAGTRALSAGGSALTSILHFCDLIDPALVPAALERRLQPQRRDQVGEG